MYINKVTISGADNKVDPTKLLGFQMLFPFVEWGILISRKRAGYNRYPTFDWIRKLDPCLNLSFHLCGDVVREFVAGNYGGMWECGTNWRRLQLNISFKEDKNWLPELLNISEVAANHPDKSFVLAYNKGSKTNLDKFMQNHVSMPSNIHFLYDSSGGRGSEIKEIQKPLINYTGYAGGLNPDNIAQIIKAINNDPINLPVWIDMETGVRTNDEFDDKKVMKVLGTCEELLNKYQDIKECDATKV